MLDRAFRFMASLRLTVVCLCFATALVFIGTLAQVDEGLYQAQHRYFRSLMVWWPVPGTGFRIIFPGGYLIGGVLLINLLAGHLKRFGLQAKKVGIFLVHIGLILLLLGQLLTDMLAVESHMRLREGETKDYSESGSRSELAIVETKLPDGERVTAVSETWLARKEDIRPPTLPFTIRIKDWFPNSGVANRAEDAKTPPAAPDGLGARVTLEPLPPTARMDQRNMPSAILEIAGTDGTPLGAWLASLWVERQQAFTAGGRSFEFSLRPARFYKPMTLTLVDFRHDNNRDGHPEELLQPREAQRPIERRGSRGLDQDERPFALRRGDLLPVGLR